MSNILTSGQSLFVNQALLSKNGKWELIIQSDGNLVLYRRENMHPVWATGTNGKDAMRALMQEDGNLVLYTYTGTPIWASNTYGKNGSFLILQDDGKLVIYEPNIAIWTSGTHQT